MAAGEDRLPVLLQPPLSAGRLPDLAATQRGKARPATIFTTTRLTRQTVKSIALDDLSCLLSGAKPSIPAHSLKGA